MKHRRANRGGTSRRELIQGGAAFIAVSSLTGGCSSRPSGRAVAPKDEIPKTDPNLVRYRQSALVPAGVPSPRAVAVDPEGGLWIAGQGKARCVRVNGMKVQQVTSFAFSGQAECLAADKTGLLIGAGNRVLSVAAPGGEARTWTTLDKDSVITCISTDGLTVLVADAGKRRVLRYRRSGEPLDILCEKDDASGYKGLIVPSPHLDVAIGADGMIYVVNPGQHVIEVRAPDGNLQWSWGETSQDIEGFSGCCNPTDIALLPDGRFVTAEKGIPRVKIYDRHGHFQCVVAGPEHLSAGVVGLDVAALADGRIAVLDPGIRAVRVFVPKEGGAS